MKDSGSFEASNCTERDNKRTESRFGVIYNQ